MDLISLIRHIALFIVSPIIFILILGFARKLSLEEKVFNLGLPISMAVASLSVIISQMFTTFSHLKQVSQSSANTLLCYCLILFALNFLFVLIISSSVRELHKYKKLMIKTEVPRKIFHTSVAWLLSFFCFVNVIAPSLLVRYNILLF